MATRTEQFRATEQRKHSADRARHSLPAGAKAPGRPAKAAAEGSKTPERRRVKPASTAQKATYALEAAAPDGRHSRKSTRGSANRAKPDANFNLRESLVKGSPEARFRRTRAKAARVRGSGDEG